MISYDDSSVWNNPFTDVPSSEWYYDSVKFAYVNGLMSGTATDRFSPKENTSRAMIVSILHRLEGKPEADAAGFADVKAGIWYESAVSWAADAGIISGYSDVLFGPEDFITREQLASIMYRYSSVKGYDTKVSSNLNMFTDADKVSDWANYAMKWAIGSNLLSGKGNGILDPNGYATRAEAAAILKRFIESTK